MVVQVVDSRAVGNGESLPVVLVVDDDEALRESFAEALRDERYVVATAGDGREALKLLTSGLRPALVLLDVWMPELDGAAALRAIRADPGIADTPVIIVTATAEDVAADVAGAASAVMKKPVNLGLLVEAIERHRRRASP